MVRNWFQSALVLCVFTVALQGQERNSLIETVSSLPGWTATGKPATFKDSNIATFNPEMASNLRTYGISGITVQAWRSPFGPVRATLFQFTDASAGYGFFTIRRRVERSSSIGFSAGTESFQAGNSRYFWQASYVVRLEGASPAMDALAKNLSESILGRSQRPPISNHLPATNLISGSEEYILDAANIPKTEGVDPSALGFNDSAEAASADYSVNGKKVHLMLLIYPTQQIAKKYTDQINIASPDLAGSRKRIGPLLAIVSGTNDSSIIQSILDQVHYESKVTWNEPPPGLGLGPVIVTVFTFIGILLGVCIVVGVSLGGIRVLRNGRYANRAFDRPGNAEFIQLKLDQELIRKELNE